MRKKLEVASPEKQKLPLLETSEQVPMLWEKKNGTIFFHYLQPRFELEKPFMKLHPKGGKFE